MEYDLYSEYGIDKKKRANGKLTEVAGDGDKCLIICGGGGYWLVSEIEKMPIAEAFRAKGYKCYILDYSVATCRFPLAYVELACAVDFVRKRENKPVGIVGFSAGGHLVGTLATMYQEVEKYQPRLSDVAKEQGFDPRPDFAVLAYPVITYDKEYRHLGSFRLLCGCDLELRRSLSLEKLVTDKVCPCFLWHTEADDCVPCENSKLFKAALDKCGVKNELILYPEGKHGLALGLEYADVATWIDSANAFIRGL